MKPELITDRCQHLSLLHPGALISIDITTPAGQRGKFRSTFIGYLPKNYILVQCPESVKLGIFAQHLVQAMPVTIRGLVERHEGAVVAFVTKVNRIIHIPSRILVLDYPSDVSLQNLRSSIRIETSINAKIKIKNEYWSTLISDLSVTGCQLYMQKKKQPPSLKKDQVIDVVVEGYQQLENIKLHATVCSAKEQLEVMVIGLAFDKSAETQVIKLLQQTLMDNG